jgi:hypothetical protein
MRDLSPFFALILLVCCAMSRGQAEEIKNADGTYSTKYTIEEATKEKAKPYDPTGRGVDMSLSKPLLSQADKDRIFPEAIAKREKKAADRAAMTMEQREREKRMLDRVPDAAKIKSKNPNLKETQSFSVR